MRTPGLTHVAALRPAVSRGFAPTNRDRHRDLRMQAHTTRLLTREDLHRRFVFAEVIIERARGGAHHQLESSPRPLAFSAPRRWRLARCARSTWRRRLAVEPPLRGLAEEGSALRRRPRAHFERHHGAGQGGDNQCQLDPRNLEATQAHDEGLLRHRRFFVPRLRGEHFHRKDGRVFTPGSHVLAASLLVQSICADLGSRRETRLTRNDSTSGRRFFTGPRRVTPIPTRPRVIGALRGLVTERIQTAFSTSSRPNRSTTTALTRRTNVAAVELDISRRDHRGRPAVARLCFAEAVDTQPRSTSDRKTRIPLSYCGRSTSLSATSRPH